MQLFTSDRSALLEKDADYGALQCSADLSTLLRSTKLLKESGAGQPRIDSSSAEICSLFIAKAKGTVSSIHIFFTVLILSKFDA